MIASSNFFLSQFYRAANAVIAPTLVVDLVLDTEQLGLLSGAFFYGFALTQIPITLLLDRIGPRRMMGCLSLIGIGGAFLFSWAQGFGTGLVGRVILGVGMACNLMGTLKLLTVWFGPLRFATLSGIVFSIGTLGNMAATSPFVFLVDLMGWRPAFRMIALTNLLVVAAFYVVVRDRPAKSAPSSSGDASPSTASGSTSHLRLLLKKKEFWIISISSMASYGVFGAFQTLWAGPYLMEAMGFSPMLCGHLILLMNAGFLIGPTLWGILSDRLFKTRKWIVAGGLVGFSALTGGLALIEAGTLPWVFAVIFLCYGLMRGTGSLMYTHIKELMPLQMAGTAMTGINFFTMMGPAVFLQGLGKVMQAFYPAASRGQEAFAVGFLLCAGCLAGISVLYAFTQDTKSSK
ncbi:MAG: MFS transporter [Deltaproteobacteria bacterium]|nr:MFS transporter [Deltaproteobacteria bacterium]